MFFSGVGWNRDPIEDRHLALQGRKRLQAFAKRVVRSRARAAAFGVATGVGVDEKQSLGKGRSFNAPLEKSQGRGSEGPTGQVFEGISSPGIQGNSPAISWSAGQAQCESVCP
jgi:hypothetical protein